MGRTVGSFGRCPQLSWNKSLSGLLFLLLCTCAKSSDFTTVPPLSPASLESVGGLLFVADQTLDIIKMAAFSDFNVSALDFTTLAFSNVHSPRAVDFDPIVGTVFWAEPGYIKRGDLDGSNHLIIDSETSANPDGLALDSVDQRVYWTDTLYDEINCIAYNGTMRKTIHNSSLDKPRGIIIHQLLRVMFWTDWGDQPKIERADLNGSNRTTIVETGLEWPNGISFNSKGNLLYWIDARLGLIEVVDLWGANRRIILSMGINNPYNLAVFGTYIIWTDWLSGGLGYTTTNGDFNGTLSNLYRDVFRSSTGIHVHVSEGLAHIEHLHLSPSRSQIVVNWTVASTVGTPYYYIIRYSLFQKLACPSPETNITELEVITNSTRHVLVGLEPYSQYQVSVISGNSAGQSEAATGYTNTSQGRPSNITNIQADLENAFPTSIRFTWQPLTCRNVNGDFWYYYATIYKDGNRSEAAAGATYLDDEISYSSVEFDNLEPCTMYELNIHAVNRLSPPGDVFYSIGETGFPYGNDGTKIPVGAVLGGLMALLMIILLPIVAVVFYRRIKQRRTSAPNTTSEANPQYENPAFDKSKAEPHTYQALDADDTHIYQAIAADPNTNLDPTHDTHTYQDPTPDTHTYLDPIPDTHTNLDPTPDTHTYLDPTPDTRTYLDPTPDTHTYLDPTPDTHMYANSSVLHSRP